MERSWCGTATAYAFATTNQKDDDVAAADSAGTSAADSDGPASAVDPPTTSSSGGGSGGGSGLPGWLRGPEGNKPNKALTEEWEAVEDPQTRAVAWRSVLTGQTTVAGAPKPDTWTEVVDKRTGLLYYWCRQTGQTTVLGEPKPGPYGRRLQLDADDLAQEGGEQRGAGRGGGQGGPSLMRLVTNPLVIGVSVMSVVAITYELAFK